MPASWVEGELIAALIKSGVTLAASAAEAPPGRANEAVDPSASRHRARKRRPKLRRCRFELIMDVLPDRGLADALHSAPGPGNSIDPGPVSHIGKSAYSAFCRQ